MKDPTEDKNAHLLVKIVEQIKFGKHSRLLLPVWVRESSLSYSMTSSKILANFEGATTPSENAYLLAKIVLQSFQDAYSLCQLERVFCRTPWQVPRFSPFEGAIAPSENAYLLTKIVELIYFAKHSRFLLPLSVGESILLYSMTSSKILANFEGATTPFRSYWILIRTLDEGASKSIPFPEGSARITFDNNQIIGETYSIRADNKVPSSIMTTTMYAQISDKELHQKKRWTRPLPLDVGRIRWG